MEKVESRIAMCVMTYCHPDGVGEILSYCAKSYYEENIDIYYFDGSPNGETEEVVKKYIDSGYDNIRYFHIEGSVPGERFELIMQGTKLAHEYDYIWYCKDRSCATKETLMRINETAGKGYDVIFLGTLNFDNLPDTHYSNASEFYRDWGWLATSMDVAIINKNTVLKDYTPETYSPEFGPHYELLFSELSKMKNPRIIALTNNICLKASPNVQSQWEQNVFTIWKDNWIEANLRLPEIYDEYKLQIIKKASSLPWILGGTARLYELKDQGILTVEKLPEIRDRWEWISNIPIEVVESIANGTFDIKHDINSLPDMNSDGIRVLKKVTESIRFSKLSIDMLPNTDVKDLICSQISLSNKITEEMKQIMYGTVSDMLSLIGKYDIEQADAANIYQALTEFYYFSLLLS